MNIEALKQQLAEGKITKEQFAAELKKLLDAGTIDQTAHDAAIQEAGDDKGDGGQAGANDGFTPEQMAAIQKMLQSETDKIRTNYSKQKKDLEDELEKLKTDKMTAEQKAEYERQKLESDLKDREAKIVAREVELHTIDKLTEAKLPLSFKSFLVGQSKEDADTNIAAFATAWQTAINEAVQAKFKELGDDPTKRGGGGGGGQKKWSEMNLTERGNLFREDREKAIQLAKAEKLEHTLRL